MTGLGIARRVPLTLCVVLVLASFAPRALPAAEPGSPVAAPPRCEVAVVSPVSGFAECVKPRGAPVDQPPARPPPSPEQCARHADLDLPECREQATPKEPPG